MQHSVLVTWYDTKEDNKYEAQDRVVFMASYTHANHIVARLRTALREDTKHIEVRDLMGNEVNLPANF